MLFLIETLVSAVILMALYAAFFGIEAISFVELAFWVAIILAAAVAAVIVVRWATERLGEALWGGGRGKATGLTAEGLARLRHGDLEVAEQLLSGSWENNPSDWEAAQGLAEIALRRGEADRYMEVTSQILSGRNALSPGERVTLSHRQADVCLEHWSDRMRAVEALARIELERPGTADAVRARQRIEHILSPAGAGVREN